MVVVDPLAARADVGAGEEHVAASRGSRTARWGSAGPSKVVAGMLDARSAGAGGRRRRGRRAQRRGGFVAVAHEVTRRPRAARSRSASNRATRRVISPSMTGGGVADLEPAFLQLRPASAEVPGVERDFHPGQRLAPAAGGGRQRRARPPVGGGAAASARRRRWRSAGCRGRRAARWSCGSPPRPGRAG